MARERLRAERGIGETRSSEWWSVSLSSVQTPGAKNESCMALRKSAYEQSFSCEMY